MNNILLFEHFNQSLELKNDLVNHLSQFPYLSYSLKYQNKSLIITFNKDVDLKYALGILDSFETDIIEKEPVKILIKDKKEISNTQEFEGKPILQNIEKVNFPELKISGVEAKMDSGATTSSIGVSDLKINRNTNKVSFIPLSKKFEGYHGKTVIMDLHSEISVQSSNGSETSRPLIKTDIVIKGKTYETFISLSDRDSLDYPVLIGKDILVNFLIQAGI